MPIKKISYKQLLETTEGLFRVNGYHRTSIDDIAKACQLRKSSIYHHIPSKTALVTEILKSVTKYFDENIWLIFYDKNMSKEEQINSYITVIEEYYATRAGGCLMGNLALETFDALDQLNELIQTFFKKWIMSVKEVLLSKFTPAEAEKLAQDIISQTQGAIMMARIYNNFDALKSVHAYFHSLVTGKVNSRKASNKVSAAA